MATTRWFRQLLASMVQGSAGLSARDVAVEGDALLVRRAGDGTSFRFALSTEAIAAYSDGHLDADVTALWGPGLPSAVGAARLASVHVAEIVLAVSDPAPRSPAMSDWSLGPDGFVPQTDPTD